MFKYEFDSNFNSNIVTTSGIFNLYSTAGSKFASLSGTDKDGENVEDFVKNINNFGYSGNRGYLKISHVTSATNYELYPIEDSTWSSVTSFAQISLGNLITNSLTYTDGDQGGLVSFRFLLLFELDGIHQRHQG